MLIARAIENQCFVLAVNRVGHDGNKVYHNGSSMVVDPTGKIVSTANDIESILEVTLKYETLQRIRRDLPFLNDMDSFNI